MLHKGKLSNAFETTCKGVEQGCISSPLLFIVILDWVLEIFDIQMKEITWRMNRSLKDMQYADDIVLMHIHRYILSKLDHLYSESMKVSLKINISKTETMKVNSTNSIPFIINSQRIEDIKQFKYLSSVISTDEEALKDINARL